MLSYSELFGANAPEPSAEPPTKKLKKKIMEMNEFGNQAIKLYGQIFDFFQSDDYKVEANTKEYVQSIINIKYNMAKIYSKLHPINFNERIQCLSTSLEYHQFIRDFIKSKGKDIGS